MFLQHLRIENCRSLNDIEIDFMTADENTQTRKWSVLVGENGTGKSTLLKAIGLLTVGSSGLSLVLGDPRSWVRLGTSECRISGTLVTKIGETRKISLTIGREDSLSDVIKRNDASLHKLDRALEHEDINYFVVGYGPYRHVAEDNDSHFRSRGSDSRSNPRAHCVRTLFDKSEVMNPLASWAMRLDYNRGDDGLAVVREAMDTLLPGVEFLGIDRIRETLTFSTPDGEVELNGLSDGYQNVAAWIGDLLFQVTRNFDHYKDPLSARGLLLIDEIDAHLHPVWQRSLRQYLDAKLPNLQIIASTHSALTLQQFQEDEAFVLRRRKAGVELEPLGVDPNRLRLHQLYDLAFGIETFDSLVVERSKAIMRGERPSSPLRGSALGEDLTEEKARQILAEASSTRSSKDAAMGNEVLESYFEKLDGVERALRQRTTDESE